MTWAPRYIVTKAPGIGGEPIPPDEPVLVIRAQDVLAIPVFIEYELRYKGLKNADPAVLEELEHHREAVRLWQVEHPPKVADR